eukprot:jgi/Chlat1/998/Chrsp108S01438
MEGGAAAAAASTPAPALPMFSPERSLSFDTPRALAARAEEELIHKTGESITGIAITEKAIAAKEEQLRRFIRERYTTIQEVEKELGALRLEVKLTAGPKKHALEHLRKRIESQNEKLLAARMRHIALSKELKAVAEVMEREEAIKSRLCSDLTLLVQQTAHAQYSRLEELTERLDRMLHHQQGSSSASAQREGRPSTSQRAGSRPSSSGSEQSQPPLPASGPSPDSNGKQQSGSAVRAMDAREMQEQGRLRVSPSAVAGGYQPVPTSSGQPAAEAQPDMKGGATSSIKIDDRTGMPVLAPIATGRPVANQNNNVKRQTSIGRGSSNRIITSAGRRLVTEAQAVPGQPQAAWTGSGFDDGAS